MQQQGDEPMSPLTMVEPNRYGETLLQKNIIE
jgi:hypothetical protein